MEARGTQGRGNSKNINHRKRKHQRHQSKAKQQFLFISNDDEQRAAGKAEQRTPKPAAHDNDETI